MLITHYCVEKIPLLKVNDNEMYVLQTYSLLNLICDVPLSLRVGSYRMTFVILDKVILNVEAKSLKNEN